VLPSQKLGILVGRTKEKKTRKKKYMHTNIVPRGVKIKKREQRPILCCGFVKKKDR
jgi:hypothetical protein